VTLFTPTQLARSPLLPSLIVVINDAFRGMEQKNGVKRSPRSGFGAMDSSSTNLGMYLAHSPM